MGEICIVSLDEMQTCLTVVSGSNEKMAQAWNSRTREHTDGTKLVLESWTHRQRHVHFGAKEKECC